MTRALLFLLILALAPLSQPRPAQAETAGVISVAPKTPRFGDSDPVEWNGRAPWKYHVHGLDVARFQDHVNWSQARRAGISFAFIKATEGGDLLDPMFQKNWRAAGKAGVPRGAYHFYYFCTEPEIQARWFIRNVPKTRGALPPVLDMEWNPHSPTCTKRPAGAEVRRQARIFMDILERHYGQRPIIYTTLEFYRETGIGKLNEEFWLRSTAKVLKTTYPGQSWSFWQYTGTGLVPGVEGNVDINVFAGSHTQWRKWLKARAR